MKLTSTNPSRNYEVIGQVEGSTEQDIKKIVAKAHVARPAWANLTIADRSQALSTFIEMSRKRAEDIAQAMATETGMLITTARGEVATTLDYLQAYIDMAEPSLAPQTTVETDTEIHRIYREPWGVIACISPWNYPFLNIAFQCGQALLAGNAIVYKPSEENPLFGKLIAELFSESEVPDGVFNVVYGDGQVGDLVAHTDVNMISFTGSTQTGKHLAKVAADKFIPIITEMGGSAPLIVFEDTAITDDLAQHIFNRRFAKSGQNCDAVKRVIVHESKFDELVQKLVTIASTTKIGDALDETTQLGPLVAERQVKRLEEQVEDAKDKGATVEAGGKRPTGLEGAYYEPTILTEVTRNMKVWQEETFGPVLPVMPFKSEAEAIELANDTPYGLAAHIFTHDKTRFHRIARRIQSGMIGQNQVMFWNPKNPFGGFKQSGRGRTNGEAGFHEVIQIKLVSEEKQQ